MVNMDSGRRLFAVIFIAITVVGCGSSGSGGTPPPAGSAERGDLVSSEVITTSVPGGKYPVSSRKLIYKTVTPDGRLINVSGMLAYPVKPAGASSPLLSFQHATIFKDEDAPSNNPSTNQALLALAASGYIAVMADYIGYAESGNEEVHTFVLAEALAAAVIDMLRATRQFLAANNIATNGQLFLTGYSEGGYATLAAQKEMEQNLAGEFSITASMPAAGPYDMSATIQWMVGQSINDNPELLGFVFKAYDYWYRLNRLDSIFQAPYANVIASYYDGTHSAGDTRNALTTNMADLFTTGFRGNFLANGETTLKTYLRFNDIYNWAPRTPTRFFHGQEDAVVPYANAATAVASMSAAGAANVGLVDCVAIPRGHEECVLSYLIEVSDWFGSLANDL